jgi:hypothetical protein
MIEDLLKNGNGAKKLRPARDFSDKALIVEGNARIEYQKSDSLLTNWMLMFIVLTQILQIGLLFWEIMVLVTPMNMR